MIDPRAILEGTDWKSLDHAYGPAADAPEALLGLLSEDPEICGDTLGYLDAAVLHQGSIYSSTTPAALFVAGILPDPRTLVLCESALPWDDRERPLRAALLEWLGSFAESAAWEDEEEDDEDEDDDEGDGDEGEGDEGDEGDGDEGDRDEGDRDEGDRDEGDRDEGDGDEEDEEWAAVEAARGIRPDLYHAVNAFLDDPDGSVRRAAFGAMGNLMLAPELAEFRSEQAERMQRTAIGAPPLDRASAALTLGNWGIAPQAFLADEDPSVRAAAAIAPPLDSDPAALEEVKRVLLDPAAADAWFTEPIPQLDGQFRFALIVSLLRRTSTYAEVREQALAVARMTNAYTVEMDWGPLLVRAFPEGYREGVPFTPAQREFVSAIVANDECWDSVSNPMIFFRQVGLPYDREQLRELIRI